MIACNSTGGGRSLPCLNGPPDDGSEQNSMSPRHVGLTSYFPDPYRRSASSIRPLPTAPNVLPSTRRADGTPLAIGLRTWASRTERRFCRQISENKGILIPNFVRGRPAKANAAGSRPRRSQRPRSVCRVRTACECTARSMSNSNSTSTAAASMVRTCRYLGLRATAHRGSILSAFPDAGGEI
jgi:hypothetical protein